MIAVLVLAAGASRRFGAQKLLAPLAGQPLVRWAVQQALDADVGRVLVVVGREAPRVRAALAGLTVEFVPSPRYREGLSASLRAGVAALDPEVDAALVVLGDQPGLRPEVVDACVEAHRAGGAPIVAARYRGQRGHPVLFARSVFPELLTVHGDEGARSVIARDPARVAWVDVDAPAPPDVDTPGDLDALARGTAASTPHAPPHSAIDR